MLRRNILSIIVVSGIVIVFAGCSSKIEKESNGVQVKANTKQTATNEMDQAQEMQLAAIKVQDENVVLKEKIEELTTQLKDLQDEFDAYKKKMAEPEKWQEKYEKAQADNDELRKLAQYERNLQEELLKRVEKDQETINELKSKLNE